MDTPWGITRPEEASLSLLKGGTGGRTGRGRDLWVLRNVKNPSTQVQISFTTLTRKKKKKERKCLLESGKAVPNTRWSLMRVSTVEPELRGLFKFSPGHPLIAIPLPAPSGCLVKQRHKGLHAKALHEAEGVPSSA